jgi:hypothetical protein
MYLFMIYLSKILLKVNELAVKKVKQLTINKIEFELAFLNKKCIFAPLINRGRVPQNLIIRLCQ